MSSELHLDARDVDQVEQVVRARKLIDDDERLEAISKGGEGYMNLTLRLTTDKRSLILKQARPWVEKYPDIAAPDRRALVETAFYRAVASRPVLRNAMPELVASDADARILLIEDLGEARDYTSLYAGGRLSNDDLESLTAYLVALHEPWDALPAVFANREMRALNHEHIFRLPLDPDNGLDLDGITPGLSEAAASLRGDRDYVDRVTALGALYLSDSPTLVHGDYFPGSWLDTPDGVRIIDPEFCFGGIPAFDLGVMLAHLHLARQPAQLGEALFSRYGPNDETMAIARRFAGVEIMRRLIGVAQLPLTYGADEKHELLERSRELIRTS